MTLPELRITVVIPIREGTYPKTTLDSLKNQTFKGFSVIVISDRGLGANWARNVGFKSVDTEFVVFSDDDIKWEPSAFKDLMVTLDAHPKASYAYGWYEISGGIRSNVEFDPRLLWHQNYISTMSLIRSKDFVGFDESLRRLQDWDLWLTMLKKGHVGVYCQKKIFSTMYKPGITQGPGCIPYDEARRIVLRKHQCLR